MIKKYYWLTKPGIIYGNLISASAGFLLASKTHVDLWLLLSVLVGTSLIIGSACVYNNVLDREIDAVMSRTKRRALVSGSVKPENALIFATILGILGFVTLELCTNRSAVFVGMVGFLDYVVFYSIAKRKGSYGTIVGSFAGATPPVAGYVAVTNHFNGAALILFLILVLWQMPHFYAIAMYRLKDYRLAGLPVLPLKKNVSITKIRILLYIVAFGIACVLLTILGYTGYIFLIAVIGLVVYWLGVGIKNWNIKNSGVWARKMFLLSLIILLVVCALAAIGRDINIWI